MKNSIVLVLAFLLVPFASAAHADFFFAASLDEAQSGGTGSAATGTAMLTLNDAMTELTMTILFDGITTTDITAFHIHAAPAGTPGPVVFGLVSPNHDEDGDLWIWEMDFSVNGMTPTQVKHLLHN